MFENASWIWYKKDAQPDEYADFKLSFNATAKKSYILHLSCDTNYALYRGNTLIAFGQYADYPDYKVYDSLDLTEFIEDGENDFTVCVWYMGVDTQTYIKKPAGLIFSLYEDGKEIVFSSQNTKSRAAKGYIPYKCEEITVQLGLSFSYDATDSEKPYQKSYELKLSKQLYKRPIKKLGIEDGFKSTVSQKGSFSFGIGESNAEKMMYAALSGNTNITATENLPVKLTAEDGFDGVYLIADMGRETAGFLDFSFFTESECDVIIGWGEHLADGRCRTAIGERKFSCSYKAKKGENSFLHPFLRLGCRYLQIFILSKSAQIKRLTIRETSYPLNIKDYKGKSLLRKTIYDVCINTLKQCMHEHYEDCPWREQALYTLDSRNQMLCGYYAFGETEFAKAALNLISYGRRHDGILSLCYPAGRDVPIPAFTLVYPLQMREYMDYSGDCEFIAEKYSFMKELIEVFLIRQQENGLITSFCGDGQWNFYEWSDGLDGMENISTPTFEAPLNAFSSIALENMALIAQKLGKDKDQKEFLHKKAEINKAIKENFYDKQSGLFISFLDHRKDEYSVLTNSLCLLCGAADGIDKTVILKILTANSAADTPFTVISNTISMNCFRFDALLKENREKFAPLKLDEIDRTYLAMLREGATAFWETAKGIVDFDGAASLCHGWSALPVYYYTVLE